MEKYLKKKRTMNECTRDLCSNDDEYKQLFNAEQLVKAGNIQSDLNMNIIHNISNNNVVFRSYPDS